MGNGTKIIYTSMLTALFLSPALANKQSLIFKGAERQVNLKVEIANTDAARKIGLMGKESLNQDEGMLFVYSRPQRACFWMKNTKIPLDIVMINQDGKVVEILENMKPNSKRQRCSQSQVVAAIEVNAGFCASNDIKPGLLVENKSLDKLRKKA